MNDSVTWKSLLAVLGIIALLIFSFFAHVTVEQSREDRAVKRAKQEILQEINQ